MIYNVDEVLIFFGKVCNDLNILRDRRYEVTLNDFDDNLHKVIFGVLQNFSLEKDINSVDGFTIDSYLKQFPVQHLMYQKGMGVEVINRAKGMCEVHSLDYSYKTIKKLSLLRRFKSIGMDISDLYDVNNLNIKEEEEKRAKLETMTIDEIKQHFKMKLIEIDLEYQTRSDSYSFRAGEGIEDLIERCKSAQNWGVTFQSRLYNAVFRGMLGSKFMIRSGGTGSGKSRQSIGDMCNISCEERYIPEKQEWVKNTNVQDSVFISTELTEDEIHLVMLATVAGVPEETIKDGKYSEEIAYRLNRASKVIKNSKMHCEYSSNFCIDELENIIEKNIIRNGAKYIFFDYIQITSNLAQELNRLFGYVLREDQMLNQLSTALKNLANKYDVFILSSTQLNRTYKQEQYLDVTSLRGGMATADKADYVVITMKLTKADQLRLQPILDEGFKTVPTHGHHVVKNRGGKWNGVILWTCTDMDTMNVKDCFVTNQDYEFIYSINPVVLN